MAGLKGCSRRRGYGGGVRFSAVSYVVQGTRWYRLMMSASLIGRLGSSTFRLSTTTAVLVSPTGSCFSSESAPRPFQYGIRRRGGTIFGAALPSYRQWVQADIRTHLIHRPARDIIPPLGGTRVSSYCNSLRRPHRCARRRAAAGEVGCVVRARPFGQKAKVPRWRRGPDDLQRAPESEP